jgi:hypothetical protein
MYAMQFWILLHCNWAGDRVWVPALPKWRVLEHHGPHIQRHLHCLFRRDLPGHTQEPMRCLQQGDLFQRS